jgi:putative membrane protein
MNISILPTLNAGLNAAGAVCLGTGYVMIRLGWRAAHRRCMLVALSATLLFFASSLFYYYSAGPAPFAGRGWVRLAYYAILGTHTLLAVVIVPLVMVTLVRALRERFALHKQIARWTLPVWLYVSVTGVVIYWLLYRAYPA